MVLRRFESAALAAGLFFVLLACKKSDPEAAADAAPAAEPTPAPVATPAPTQQPVATASASAAPTPNTPTAPTTRPVVKPKDGGTVDAAAAAKPDAGVAAATADAGPNPDLAAIQACCRALTREAARPGLSQNQYRSAATVCNGIADQVRAGKADAKKARTSIRAQLQGVTVPPSC